MSENKEHNHDHEHDHDHDHEDTHEYITIVNEQGDEELYEILFTFDSVDYEKSYVLVFPASSSEGDEVELEAFSYQETDGGLEGTLSPIESDEEWDMIEEVLNTFIEEEEE
ncbi:DUF1292 domain-containing protein [Lacticigenium naphthae]|uniref:DUF1292 domain-containing protein n=1 Tax=Lacticigenium naphthae TaxID=515351 RepID=UPI0003F5B61A|nr:DUF1292 domain-containing protein [Lacticigenium naphthae]